MPVNLRPPGPDDGLVIPGVRLAAVNAGIKNNENVDLVLVELATGSNVSAVYTQNAFCAAPVIIAKQHHTESSPRYLLINSGNANAGTGEQGLAAAKVCCQSVAETAGVLTTSVLPFSTGVIGQTLPAEKITAMIPNLYQSLSADSWLQAAHGIMTTDTVAKLLSKQIELAGKTITITGMAKGSGMIRPDMATMLAYIATDAAVDQVTLDAMLQHAVEQSFNRITVDGDTSTNDACVLIATGHADNDIIKDINSDYGQQLLLAITELCQSLAQAVIRDGEGATKFIEIEVKQGRNKEECRHVAYTIAHSPLIKTAFFASDPNWGRILAAVGRSGLTDFDLTKVDIFLGDVCIIRAGEPAEDYTEAAGQKVMDETEIAITVSLDRGQESDKVWTCDFSYDYVRINAEYRS